MVHVQEINFLDSPSDKRLRREVQNIVDSYSHPWDILSELVQNSVDAIRQYERSFSANNPKKHKIEIVINAISRSISVRDSGIGFSLSDFADLLAPHGTNKDGDPLTIGEKGVGLTYTILTSDHYSIDTQSTTAKIAGTIERASSWRLGKSQPLPRFIANEWLSGQFSPKESYSLVQLSDVDQVYPPEDDIFHQNVEVIDFILRTKTAIGWVKSEFSGERLQVEVELDFTDLSNRRSNHIIKTEYYFPHLALTDNGYLNLDDFKSVSATLDDRQKAKKLQGKAIIRKGAVDRAGRRINFYAFFAPSRKLWKEISEKHKFVRIDDKGEHRSLFEGGIFIATKGMPTGIQIDPPPTGNAGYWPNFFILFEDDAIIFDLGRKSIPSRTKGLLRDIAKGLFNEFTPFIGYATSDPPVITSSSTIRYHEKTKEFDILRQLPDLGVVNLPYLKHPDGQEAGVVAIFHEMVAAGILKGYLTLKTGYRRTYDLWAVYSVNAELIGASFRGHAGSSGKVELPIVIEFKYRAEDILADVERETKFFMDIDLIVCWDLDEKAFAKQSVSVEVVTPDDVLFHGSNFKLIWPGAYNLGPASEKPVISLRRLIHNLKSST